MVGGGWVATNFSVSSRQGFKLWGLLPWLPSLADPCLTLAWASQKWRGRRDEMTGQSGLFSFLIRTWNLLKVGVTVRMQFVIIWKYESLEHKIVWREDTHLMVLFDDIIQPLLYSYIILLLLITTQLPSYHLLSSPVIHSALASDVRPTGRDESNTKYKLGQGLLQTIVSGPLTLWLQI